MKKTLLMVIKEKAPQKYEKYKSILDDTKQYGEVIKFTIDETKEVGSISIKTTIYNLSFKYSFKEIKCSECGSLMSDMVGFTTSLDKKARLCSRSCAEVYVKNILPGYHQIKN